MKFFITLITLGALAFGGNFTLESGTLTGQLTKAEEFGSFGCSGKNISPELHWENPPKGTKSFAITVYDPNAPTGSGWWHWLVVNIPADAKAIAANASAEHKLPKGAVETMTDYGFSGFGGACPPKGDKAHAYIFTVYALDTESLDVKDKTDSAQVGYNINAHTIQKATIVSYYQRD
ncbi:MAG: YbhB/YbcL family Raf kinase inhibitor-like protein [Thiovulaceae bacterium]|nr:YbhB/YbcL family Raf kinase inhibitor-like protein [Sulfurimonadaceae bacterium]